MRNTYFNFKAFTIHQQQAAMKVTTDSCLFGAWVADRLKNRLSPDHSLLDIGTGTGLLSLMIAQQCNGHIDAIEIEEQAFAQARENINASPWKDRVQPLLRDMRNWQPELLYDFIFANPPFYEHDLASLSISRHTAHHSREFSLTALFDFIQQYLKPSGKFYLLLPHKRKEALLSLLQQKQLYAYELMAVNQSVLHQPFRIMIEAGKEKALLQEQELSICEADKKTYTTAFRQLLSPYYLYL